MNIIRDNDIDEDLAREFLQSPYNELELLPGIPERLTVLEAASVLSVSEPTIQRMLEDNQIKLSKTSILAYITQNFSANRPLNLSQIAPNHPR